MLSMTLIDPRQAVMIESGLGLDAIGAMKGVDLPRDGVEPDVDYRSRLMVRLWNPLAVDLTPAVATGEYLNQWVIAREWRGPMGTETTAPADDSKPRQNHVRDAVLNNLTD
jgi:hypothetical protein